MNLSEIAKNGVQYVVSILGSIIYQRNFVKIIKIKNKEIK